MVTSLWKPKRRRTIIVKAGKPIKEDSSIPGYYNTKPYRGKK